LGDLPREDACSARDIQHQLAGFNFGCSSHKACRLQEERRHEELLVYISSTPINLT